jgi:hypothetical protein
MTAQHGIPSVDDADLASYGQIAQEEIPVAELNRKPAEAGRETRVQELIRRKQAANAVAAQSAANAAALREGVKNPGRLEDYQAPEEYTRAVAERAVREVGAEMLARQAAQAQGLAERAAQDAWAESTSEFRQKVPDFDAVAHNPNLEVTPVMADAIRESSRGAEIAYYLGKNPAEAAQIASLSPVSQATAITRLEAQLSSGASPVSRAPAPVGTLSGRGGSGGKRLEDMNFEEYRRARGY